MNKQQDAEPSFAELCQQLGYSVLTFAPMLDRMGWEHTSGARRYLHATTPASGLFLDFLDLACDFRGASEARERLLNAAAVWGLHPLPAPAAAS